MLLLNVGFEQRHGAPNDILSELLSADEVYTEVPFCYDSGSNNIVNGVMDAIYLKDGEWHIIDYKTDDEIDPEGLKHQAQLDAYIEAFKELTGNTADAKIYHIEIQNVNYLLNRKKIKYEPAKTAGFIMPQI